MRRFLERMHKKDVNKLKGTPFQKQIWKALLDIPFGQTRSYKEIAIQIGKPSASRAVANAIGKNPCAPQIPCHRVIKSNGELGGYSAKGGIKRKKKLLKLEVISSQ